jgi:hypothetical protein
MEMNLEKVVTCVFEAAGDGIRFASKDRSVEFEVAGGFCDADIGGNFIACSDLNDVAGDEFSSGERAPIPISQHGDLSRQHARDGRNNTARTPILAVRSSSKTQNMMVWVGWGVYLPRIEKGLHTSDNEKDDAEGEVGDLRSRFAKRFPGNTTQDTGSDQEGAKPAKHVEYYPAE